MGAQLYREKKPEEKPKKVKTENKTKIKAKVSDNLVFSEKTMHPELTKLFKELNELVITSTSSRSKQHKAVINRMIEDKRKDIRIFVKEKSNLTLRQLLFNLQN